MDHGGILWINWVIYRTPKALTIKPTKRYNGGKVCIIENLTTTEAVREALPNSMERIIL